MTDKELLELAAKAAGREVTFYPDGICRDVTVFQPMQNVFAGKPWNPITDDGDALRLAVKLRMDINRYKDEVGAVQHSQHGGKYSRYFVPLKDDPYAATRRAIVRAAAEIGKEMK